MVEFEWLRAKNAANVAKHGIDFIEAAGIFTASVVVFQSDRQGEARWGATGMSNGREITVFYTVREMRYRIISARRARKDERRRHSKVHPGG
jgi:uncharacterized protein